VNQPATPPSRGPRTTLPIPMRHTSVSYDLHPQPFNGDWLLFPYPFSPLFPWMVLAPPSSKKKKNTPATDLELGALRTDTAIQPYSLPYHFAADPGPRC